VTKEELKNHIDWLVGTLPPFPPAWATKALGELIEKHKELDAIESAVLAEREACAKVCDENAAKAEANGYTCKGETFIDGFGDGSCACAAAIRARGEK
jgi:hypothetical protein